MLQVACSAMHRFYNSMLRLHKKTAALLEQPFQLCAALPACAPGGT